MTVTALSCPNCSTLMQTTARFCPGCGEPRTAVRQELEQAAVETGVPYDRLLERSRAENTARPTLLVTPTPGVPPMADRVPVQRDRISGVKKAWITGGTCFLVLIAVAGSGPENLPALAIVFPIIVFVFVKYL